MWGIPAWRRAGRSCGWAQTVSKVEMGQVEMGRGSQQGYRKAGVIVAQ